MDKVEKLIKELQEVCNEEGLNMIAAVTENGDGQSSIGVVGLLPELIFLINLAQHEIAEKTEMPYEILEMMVAFENKND